MKTTKGKNVFFLTRVIFCVWMIISFITTHSTARGNEPVTSEDSSSIINFYNPSGSFIYQPDASVNVNEREMKAGLLYDLENKKIVWQKEMNNPYPIASLTKMMVALLTVENIHAGNVNWTDNVKWTREIITGRGKKKSISTQNMGYSLLDLFKAAMIASNNEAAEQMARYVGGGDLQAFIDRMNTRARELSMNSTYYGNPTGLPSISKTFDNASTPLDLLLLTLEMLKYDEILQVTGMGYADISNGRSTSTIRNHNHLTIDYKGEVDGMKTGYTKRAGFCLAATSNKCDHRLISIVLGSRSPNLRNEVVKDMINDYYSSVGLDKLGPNCGAPNYVNAVTPSSGEYAYKTTTVNKTHVVKQGENLASIAYQYNCTPANLKAWNKLRSGKVVPGKKLTIVSTLTERIPVAKNTDEETGAGQQFASDDVATQSTPDESEGLVKNATPEKAKVTLQTNAQKSKYIIYVVQPGDTLFSIAKRYDLAGITQLKAVNKIPKGRMLKVGDKIKVPVNG